MRTHEHTNTRKAAISCSLSTHARASTPTQTHEMSLFHTIICRDSCTHRGMHAQEKIYDLPSFDTNEGMHTHAHAPHIEMSGLSSRISLHQRVSTKKQEHDKTIHTHKHEHEGTETHKHEYQRRSTPTHTQTDRPKKTHRTKTERDRNVRGTHFAFPSLPANNFFTKVQPGLTPVRTLSPKKTAS